MALVARINELANFSQLPVEEFAYEQGYAYHLARDVGAKMKVHQLRKFFSEIKKIETDIQQQPKTEGVEHGLNDNTKVSIALLMPELAYAKGRKLITQDFYDVMKTSLSPERMKTQEDFTRFCQFLTAVVAYAKLFQR